MDNQWHIATMFLLVSCPVLLVAVWAYQPDRRMRDWAIREVRLLLVLFVVTCVDTRVLQAYLVLKEREDAGVEPISKDFVDSAKILAHLPSDEELKEAGVVINV